VRVKVRFKALKKGKVRVQKGGKLTKKQEKA
jgi:hypothetical protein